MQLHVTVHLEVGVSYFRQKSAARYAGMGIVRKIHAAVHHTLRQRHVFRIDLDAYLVARRDVQRAVWNVELHVIAHDTLDAFVQADYFGDVHVLSKRLRVSETI